MPTTNWVLDYAENRCRIVREFASPDGNEKTVLFFEQQVPEQSYTWLVAGSAVPNRSTISVRFGPVNQTRETPGRQLSFGQFEQAIRGTGFSPTLSSVAGSRKKSSENRLRESTSRDGAPSTTQSSMPRPPVESIEWLDIEAGTRNAVRIPLAEMPQIAKAMESCMDDLVRSWGVDPAQQAKVAHPPKWKNLDHVAQRIVNTYPDKAARRGEQADLQLRLMIEASGEPSKCVRTNLTQADNFDNSACLAIMKDAEFEPARDTEGRPVRSYLVQRIKYILP